jgi:hypothetical protein
MNKVEAIKTLGYRHNEVPDEMKVKLPGIRQSEEYCRGLENSLCYWQWYKKQNASWLFTKRETSLSFITKYVLWSWKTIALHLINGSREVTWGFRKTFHVSKRRCNTQAASVHPQASKAFREGIRKPHRCRQLWHAGTAWNICFQ